MTVSGRYYLIRTPAHRGKPFTEAGLVYGNKRIAIAQAKAVANDWSEITPVRDRRISVYTVDPGKRPTLLFQCHADRKTGKIVSEVL